VPYQPRANVQAPPLVVFAGHHLDGVKSAPFPMEVDFLQQKVIVDAALELFYSSYQTKIRPMLLERSCFPIKKPLGILSSLILLSAAWSPTVPLRTAVTIR